MFNERKKVLLAISISILLVGSFAIYHQIRINRFCRLMDELSKSLERYEDNMMTMIHKNRSELKHMSNSLDKLVSKKVDRNPVYPGRRENVKNTTQETKDEFVKYITKAAKAESKIYKDIPYQIYVAQAILESNYGQSTLAKTAKNLYGHKHKTKSGNFIKSYDDKRDDKFTVFRSRWESIRAHSKKLMGIYRQRITGEPTLEKWIESLCGGNTTEESLKFIESGNSVYATNCYKLSSHDDICYADKIRSIIKKYSLK
jgi:flagellum-specific peptidoglycan hydrolase FlgJ